MTNLLCFVLTVYTWVLYARIILSFVFLFKPGWAPPQGLRPVLDMVYAVTDPPVNALRRVIPQPMGFPIDLAFLVWFLAVFFVHGQICSLRFG
jgi:YggT family protein